MRAVTILDGRVEVADISEPPGPGAGQVLIAVDSCGICGSDLSLWRDTKRFVDVSVQGGNVLSAFDPTRPVTPGHEFSGTVVQTGGGVDDFAVGDRVAGIGLATDPSTGIPTIIGYSNEYPGAFAERIVADASYLRHVPETLTLEAASLAEPLHVGETHVQQARIDEEGIALVIGAGPIGLGVVIALAARSVSMIVVVEPSPRRRELAVTLGAHRAVAPPDGGPAAALDDSARSNGVVHVFECSGRQGTLAELTRTLPYGSHIQVVASPFREETFIPVIAQWRQLVINFGSGPVDDPYGVTLGRLAAGEIPTELLITGRVGLDGVADALREVADPERHVKIVVQPSA